MHLDLSEFQSGASAELRDQAPHGLVKFVQRIMFKFEAAKDKDGKTTLTSDEAADIEEQLHSKLLSQMVPSWYVKDLDGKEVPPPRDATTEQMDLVDSRIYDKVVESIKEILNRSKTDPNSESVSS